MVDRIVGIERVLPQPVEIRRVDQRQDAAGVDLIDRASDLPVRDARHPIVDKGYGFRPPEVDVAYFRPIALPHRSGVRWRRRQP